MALVSAAASRVSSMHLIAGATKLSQLRALLLARYRRQHRQATMAAAVMNKVGSAYFVRHHRHQPLARCFPLCCSVPDFPQP